MLKKIKKLNKEEIILGWIIISALLVRIILLYFRQSLCGGDPFNFLFIAEKLKEFSYPQGAKRLPFYPFLLLLGFPFFDPVRWGQTISILSSVLLLPVLYGLGRLFKIKKEILLGASLLLAFQSSVLEISLQPLSDSLFAFLFLLSLFLFYRLWTHPQALTPNSQLLFGTILGLTCLTRNEGFLLSLILFLFLFWKKGLKTCLISGIPYFCLVFPWFVRNFIHFGHPFYSPYFSAKGYGCWQWLNFKNSVYKLLSLYGPIKGGREVFYGGLLGSIFIIIGCLKFIREKWPLNFPWLTVILAHLVLITWWTPLIRLFLPIIPLTALFLSQGIFRVGKIYFPKDKFKQNIFSLILLGIVLYSSLSTALPRLRAANHEASVWPLYRILKYIEKNHPEGKVGLAVDYPIAVFYLKNRGVYLERKKEPVSFSVQKKWLLKEKPTYLIQTFEDKDILTLPQQLPLCFNLIKTTFPENKNFFAKLYKVKYNQCPQFLNSNQK